MDTNNYILVEKFCMYHEVEHTFILSLEEYGLIKLIDIDNNTYISEEQLSDLEKMVRLHNDLEINIHGIVSVINLLKQIEDLNFQLQATKNKLTVFSFHGNTNNNK